MKLAKKISSVLIAVLLLAVLPVNTFAKEHDNRRVVEYVALGDSLAYGQTPYRTKDLGYPDYLKQRIEQLRVKVDYVNFGVPGYTSFQLKNDLLNSALVRDEIKTARLITIDIGANDLLGTLQTNPANAGAAIQSVSANLQTILSTIDQLNPKANVYVMGYYNPFPYLPSQQQASLLPLLHALNQQILLLSAAHGDTFVPTETVIAKNYQLYLPNPQDIHLSLAGYKAVANEFSKAILGDQINKIIKEFETKQVK
ncbi:SGNH/GDSL hydrolase family protein [Bacillus sp. T33-2]|uniref:SGNH/GDSL hydrolase family protein n=1 Tax=Bacillus sp. T33-2 TaxID=2054168 RepID=UPI000C78710C|nr:SGNH/GDSL hydrolase family protein [Bacillus sp. T33-2]PLR94881.1 hypothetical protein CVD19_16580 [Bacillus sp. T33-2]